jgi:16S rRNA pseudouridine516 synthase
MRIDKFLCLQGYTRGEARIFLKSGRVAVDGAGVRDGAFSIDPMAARVRLDGEDIVYFPSLHLMLHKPAGILTAADDFRLETVMDLLPRHARAQDCMPVGRLDMDTEGLLLFTTDGQLSHRLLSPKRRVEKCYAVMVDQPLSRHDEEAFADGLPLSDFVALPAVLEVMDNVCEARVTLTEGKFHQVKRMFAARGKRVLSLKRLSFGGVLLDPALAPGAWRALTPSEVEALYTVSGMR